MKRLWFTGAALAAVALFTVVASPGLADDGSHGPVVTIVSGGSRWQTTDGVWRRFAFTARQYQDNHVEGEWQLVAGAAIVHGNVLCLTLVDDRNARVGGRIEKALFTAFQPGTDVGWVVVDGGEGGSGTGDQTSSLRAFLNSPPGSAEAFCTTGQVPPGGNLGVATIDMGNFQIIRLQ